MAYSQIIGGEMFVFRHGKRPLFYILNEIHVQRHHDHGELYSISP